MADHIGYPPFQSTKLVDHTPNPPRDTLPKYKPIDNKEHAMNHGPPGWIIKSEQSATIDITGSVGALASGQRPGI